MRLRVPEKTVKGDAKAMSSESTGSERLSGYGYGFVPQEGETRKHWWPKRLDEDTAIKECQRQLSCFGLPIYIQFWVENEQGCREKVGQPRLILRKKRDESHVCDPGWVTRLQAERPGPTSSENR